MNTELNFLSPAVYEDICHYAIIPGEEDKIFKPEILYKNAIIFCKIDYIDYLFQFLKTSIHKYILITHHSDYPVDAIRFSKKPYNVIKWFGINVTYKHPDLIPIPCGLLTHRGIWHAKGQNPLWLVENSERLQKNEKNLEKIYCNWTVTNGDRNLIIPKLEQAGIKYQLESKLTFEQYCENMSNYKFVISPPGNGIDGQRTYEAMYCGCIPIVIKHYIYESWKELPMIQVNDYSEITYELLYSYLNREYNMEKLYMTYWKNKIQKTFKEL